MKKLIFGIITFGITVMATCQTDPVNSFFEKYTGLEGITIVNVTGDMLKLITEAEQEHRDTVFSSKLSSIRVLSVQKKSDKPVEINFRTEILDKLDKSYKEMMTVKSEDDDIVILMKEKDGRVAEIVIVAGGNNNNALIQVKGDILLSELAQLGDKYQMKGLEQLKKLEH